MPLVWVIRKFHELTAAELYSVMQLRNEVFVVEQYCVYQDADGKDKQALHLAGWEDGELIAYCRILPPGICFPESSIGRVVSSPKYRKTGAGKELMKMAIGKAFDLFSCTTIRIGAQLYLANFYTSFGFVQCSETYLEDGIPHIEMQLKKSL